MTIHDTVDWVGQSGKTYRYIRVDMSKPIDPVSANYSFARHLGNGIYIPDYFGETENARDRLTPSHHKWAAAIAIGAVHVFGHSAPAGYLARAYEEQDLIAQWQPVLNIQHRQAR